MTGIPIDVALKRISERDSMAEHHKFFPTVKFEEPCTDEEATIRDIEKSFTAEAEQLLDGFNLSHMRPKTKTPHRHSI